MNCVRRPTNGGKVKITEERKLVVFIVHTCVLVDEGQTCAKAQDRALWGTVYDTKESFLQLRSTNKCLTKLVVISFNISDREFLV